MSFYVTPFISSHSGHQFLTHTNSETLPMQYLWKNFNEIWVKWQQMSTNKCMWNCCLQTACHFLRTSLLNIKLALIFARQSVRFIPEMNKAWGQHYYMPQWFVLSVKWFDGTELMHISHGIKILYFDSYFHGLHTFWQRWRGWTHF